MGKVLDFYIHNLVGQTELGDTVFQYAADFVQCLEYGNIVTIFRHISGERQTGGSRTDYSNLNAVLFFDFRHGDLSAFPLVICGEAFQITDGNRLFVHLQMDTLGFALFFLRAHTTANSGQCAGFFQCFGCFQKLAAFYILDETGYVYTYGATLHAPRIGAVQTAFGLCQSLFLGQSPVHFFLAAV